MSIPTFQRAPSPEERREREERRIREAYFEPGRTYRWDWWHVKERQAVWIENFWHPSGYVWRWTAFIKQVEHPYMIIHCKSFRTPIGMWLWAKRYLRLGRPPGWPKEPWI